MDPKQLGLATKRCASRPYCTIKCKSGGPVPRRPDCAWWADHLKKEALAVKLRKQGYGIEYDFTRKETDE